MKRIWIVLGGFMGLILVVGVFGFQQFYQGIQDDPIQETWEMISVVRCDISQTVTAPGKTVHTHEEVVVMPIMGLLAEINVLPGDYVYAGQILAKLDNETSIKLEISEAKLALLQAQQVLEELYQNAPVMKAQLLVDLNMAKFTLREEIKIRERMAWSNPSPEKIAVNEANIELGEAKLDYYNMEWQRLQNGRSALDLKLAEEKIENARVRMKSAEEALEKLTIIAPYDGIVLAVYAKEGKVVQANEPLFLLIEPTNIEVEVSIIEEDFPYVEAGQHVELFFDALPEIEETGTVTRIVPKRLPGDRPLYAAYIGLDDVPNKLVEGMNADALLVVAQKNDVLCLPQAIISASAQDTGVVDVLINDVVEKREVELGLRGDVNVEIISGLNEGDSVLSP